MEIPLFSYFSHELVIVSSELNDFEKIREVGVDRDVVDVRVEMVEEPLDAGSLLFEDEGFGEQVPREAGERSGRAVKREHVFVVELGEDRGGQDDRGDRGLLEE